MNKIIIIEDESNISESLKLILEEESLQVTIFEKGLEGLQHWQNHDLMILDLMLPDTNGLYILKKIREVAPTYPILIVSAKSTEEDLIKGLELGADDYITKPFSVRELTLRIKRTLARKKLLLEKSTQEQKEYSFGNNFKINFSDLNAHTNMGNITLTTQEAEILQYLITNPNKLISRNELLEKIWGHSNHIETRTIDNFIVRFRKYFEKNPKKPTYFITKRGVGYIFSP